MPPVELQNIYWAPENVSLPFLHLYLLVIYIMFYNVLRKSIPLQGCQSNAYYASTIINNLILSNSWSRLNSGPQIYSHPILIPRNCECYLIWQKGLCKYKWTKGLEVGRLSWIIPWTRWSRMMWSLQSLNEGHMRVKSQRKAMWCQKQRLSDALWRWGNTGGH